MTNIIMIRAESDDLLFPAVAHGFSIDGSMALHRTEMKGGGFQGWTISHLRTGLSILVGIRTKAHAEQAMEALTIWHGDTIRKITKAHRDRMTPIIRKLRDAIKPIAQNYPMHFLPHYWR